MMEWQNNEIVKKVCSKIKNIGKSVKLKSKYKKILITNITRNVNDSIYIYIVSLLYGIHSNMADANDMK